MRIGVELSRGHLDQVRLKIGADGGKDAAHIV
jgi:hypothetical protein